MDAGVTLVKKVPGATTENPVKLTGSWINVVYLTVLSEKVSGATTEDLVKLTGFWTNVVY